jgi:hypothetical protein
MLLKFFIVEIMVKRSKIKKYFFYPTLFQEKKLELVIYVAFVMSFSGTLYERVNFHDHWAVVPC